MQIDYRTYRHQVACAIDSEFGTTQQQIGRWIVNQEDRIVEAFRTLRDVMEVAFEVVEHVNCE
jgi:hypothetical protein